MARPSIWDRNWARFAKRLNRHTSKMMLDRLAGRPPRPYPTKRRP